MWRRMKRTKWIYSVSNDEILNRIKEERIFFDTIIKIKAD